MELIVPVSLKKKSVLDLELAWETKSIYSTVLIEPGFSCIGKYIVDIGLPKSIIIALIERGNMFLISEGSTELLQGDRLYIMADDMSVIDKLYICIGKQIDN